MIYLRAATSNDLDLLKRWDEQPHVISADPNDDWGWEVELDRSPDWREQLIAHIASTNVLAFNLSSINGLVTMNAPFIA
nr:hypothetical protein [Chamaesiphon sp. OTE_8_metabat_110]